MGALEVEEDVDDESAEDEFEADEDVDDKSAEEKALDELPDADAGSLRREDNNKEEKR